MPTNVTDPKPCVSDPLSHFIEFYAPTLKLQVSGPSTLRTVRVETSESLPGRTLNLQVLAIIKTSLVHFAPPWAALSANSVFSCFQSIG